MLIASIVLDHLCSCRAYINTVPVVFIKLVCLELSIERCTLLTVSFSFVARYLVLVNSIKMFDLRSKNCSLFGLCFVVTTLWIVLLTADPISAEDGFSKWWITYVWFYLTSSNKYAVVADKIKRCKYGDTKCLAETMTRIFVDYPNGIPEIGLGSLDPFVIASSSLGSGDRQANGALVPINLNITMKNIKVRGWKKLEVTSVM